MNLEGIDIDQIRQIVLEEYKFYSEKKGWYFS